MSNTSALCNSFKAEVLEGVHALGTSVVRATTAPDVIMAALYLSTATLNAQTTEYSTVGEVSGVGYTPGGVVVANSVAPVLDGTSACWTPSAPITFDAVTLAGFDTVLLYNATQGNRAIAVYTFGVQSVTAGTLTLTLPANDAADALVRIA